MSDHHLILAVERGELSMREAFEIIKQGDDAHQTPQEDDMTCDDCGREIERDPFRGKPVGAKGFCVGFATCHQDPTREPRRIWPWDRWPKGGE